METIFMNTENSKASESHKLVLNLSQRLDLRSSNKHGPLQTWSTNYNWKKRREQYKNNKLKIIAATWNNEFELPDASYSVSDIQDYIEYIIKKHVTLSANPPIHIYVYRINNRLVFNVKDGYKLELQTPATMILLGSTKKN